MAKFSLFHVFCCRFSPHATSWPAGRSSPSRFLPISLSFLVFAMQLQCVHVAAKIHSLFHLPSPSPLQIRQYSYHDVVCVSEVEDVLDITNVQIYVINSARVLFLQEYLHERQRQPPLQMRDLRPRIIQPLPLLLPRVPRGCQGRGRRVRSLTLLREKEAERAQSTVPARALAWGAAAIADDFFCVFIQPVGVGHVLT